MTNSTTSNISPGHQPIVGYTLEELIGRGGFGEVWRANAPGGLKKALKFVYGAKDQHHASRELRSLERIKGINHPFLLTLERIEFVDNRLLIVTELADGSLEDVFKRNRERGSCGIPRDVLLNYLHDASDALDYLHDCYQLQHLDIKPGNLLLVGGHVKVADFGLLKDLREADCSMVGGLTPVYAPPEVFDGRPSLHSDQYSLAVMYQELLTGTRPFSGRTIAQLATQHVHSAPNLESLPPCDRPIAARALEKNPDRRFPSCKEFVESLRNPRGRSISVTSRGDDLESADTQHGVAGLVDTDAKTRVADLPQIDVGQSFANQAVTGHAMVVALGGTGADCLRGLRGRVANLHLACPVDLHSLLIDTDATTIDAVRVSELSDRLPPCKAIHTPLRSALAYRQRGTERLKSISRRWIYNVPRSGTTEGMRPLGRLALVDHSDLITRTLRDSIAELANAAGDKTPTVYVVGSLTGGTGSGMFIDIAYLLRHLLDEAGLESTRILSMLSATALQNSPTHPLALHDTQAALAEMQYFMSPGNGYPGDRGAGWPSVPAARTPLHDVYVVAGATRYGSGPRPVQTIIDYVWSDATGAGRLLAAARRSGTGDEPATIQLPSLRSVGVVELGSSTELENLLTPPAVSRLLIRWLGRPSEARKAAAPLADRLMRRCGISVEALTEATIASLKLDRSELRRDLLARLRGLSGEELDDDDKIDQNIALSAADHLGKNSDDLAVGDSVANVIGNLTRELSVLIHDRQIDLTTAIESIRLLISRSRQNEERIRIRSGSDEANMLLSASIRATSQIDEEIFAAEDSHEFRLRVEQACSRGNVLLGRSVHHQVAQCIERLCQQLTMIEERSSRFASRLALAIVEAKREQASAANPWQEMPKEIREQFEPVLDNLHAIVGSDWLIRPICESDIKIDASIMVAAIADAAMPLIANLMRASADVTNAQSGDSNTRESADSTDTEPRPGDSAALRRAASGTDSFAPSTTAIKPLSVDQALEAVRPALLSCGGLQRLILIVGSEAERHRFEPKIRAAHDGAATVAVIPGSAPKLIHEAQRIEMNDVLARLTTLNGGDRQISGRLMTRTDIAWQAR